MSGRTDFPLPSHSCSWIQTVFIIGRYKQSCSQNSYWGGKQGRINPSTDMAQVDVLPWGCVFSMAVSAAPHHAHGQPGP